MNAGDVLLFRGSGWQSALIRWGQRRRPDLQAWAGYTHVAVALDRLTIAEARFRGVRTRSHEEFWRDDFVVVPAGVDLAQRVRAATFMRYLVGQKYGAVTILGLALNLLFGLSITVGEAGQYTCSGAAAMAYPEIDWGTDPQDVVPARIGAILRAPTTD